MPIYGLDDIQPFPEEAFADVLSGNDDFASRFSDSGLSGTAARGLAVITCMDSRIDPLGVLGMQAGDVKILRNAGARVTDDVLRTLILATYLLNVTRVLVMPHTECRMTASTESEIHAEIARDHGVDTRSVEFRTVADTEAALITDVVRIRANALLPSTLVVGGAVYDVHTGRLQLVRA